MTSLVMTLMSLIAVTLLMVGVLYGLRWLMNKSPGHLFKTTDRLRVLESHSLDSKRRIVRCQFAACEYVLLLGESDVLLDKKEISLGATHD